LKQFQKYDLEVGEIPEGWELRTIGEMAKLDGGYAFSSKDYVNEGVRLLRITNVTFGRINLEDSIWLPKIYVSEYAKFSLKEGDIVLVLTRPITGGGIKAAKIEKSHLPLLLNQRVGKFIVKDNNRLSKDFLYYLIFSKRFIELVKQRASVTHQPNISSSDIEKFQILLPKIEEQLKIVSILSNVDKLIQKIDRISERTQRLKRGLMQRLLTKGIEHNRFKKVSLSRLNVSQLTGIPYEWEVKTLNDIALINPESINENYKHHEINYIEIGAISNYEIQEYVTHSLSKRPSRAQRIVKRGDIIVSTVRPYLRGFTLVNDSRPNLICSTGFAVIRPENIDDVNFIFNYIKSKLFEDNIFRKMEGMAYPAITSSDVANAIIPYPNDKKEMLKIGSVLDNIDSSLKLKSSFRHELENLKKGLMQKLLTGKTRVKV
jgi:type I restriction enzyme S subunit